MTSSWQEVLHQGVASEKFGKEERGKQNDAVVAEEEVNFYGASALWGKAQQIWLVEDRGAGRGKYRGILILGLLPFSFSLLFSFFQLPYFLWRNKGPGWSSESILAMPYPQASKL